MKYTRKFDFSKVKGGPWASAVAVKSLPHTQVLKSTPQRWALAPLAWCILAMFGGKAYRDQATKQALAAQRTTMCMSDKKEKGQKVYKVGQSGLWSRFVSAMRQPIESYFNWLVKKGDIQNAAKVRSSEGLQVHCYGKLTAAFYLLCFHP
jgi:hypothetical protein